MTIHESNYMDENEVRYQRTRTDPFNRKANALIERLDAIPKPPKEESSANTPAVRSLQ